MNEQMELYNKLIQGEVSSMVICKPVEDDSRIKDVCNYLDGKGVGYTLNEINHYKYGKGIEVKLSGKQAVDYTDVELTKEEVKLLNRIDIKQVEDYYYFMTPKQMDDIRFDLIKHLRPNVDLTVSYSQGLVIIK